jgi:hypothetical protein
VTRPKSWSNFPPLFLFDSHAVRRLVILQLTVGDESYEDLKESVKGWVELDGIGALKYHKKHGLVHSKVSSTF